MIHFKCFDYKNSYKFLSFFDGSKALRGPYPNDFTGDFSKFPVNVDHTNWINDSLKSGDLVEISYEDYWKPKKSFTIKEFKKPALTAEQILGNTKLSADDETRQSVLAGAREAGLKDTRVIKYRVDNYNPLKVRKTYPNSLEKIYYKFDDLYRKIKRFMLDLYV